MHAKFREDIIALDRDIGNFVRQVRSDVLALIFPLVSNPDLADKIADISVQRKNVLPKFGMLVAKDYSFKMSPIPSQSHQSQDGFGGSKVFKANFLQFLEL